MLQDAQCCSICICIRCFVRKTTSRGMPECMPGPSLQSNSQSAECPSIILQAVFTCWLLGCKTCAGKAGMLMQCQPQCLPYLGKEAPKVCTLSAAWMKQVMLCTVS